MAPHLDSASDSLTFLLQHPFPTDSLKDMNAYSETFFSLSFSLSKMNLFIFTIGHKGPQRKEKN